MTEPYWISKHVLTVLLTIFSSYIGKKHPKSKSYKTDYHLWEKRLTCHRFDKKSYCVIIPFSFNIFKQLHTNELHVNDIVKEFANIETHSWTSYKSGNRKLLTRFLLFLRIVNIGDLLLIKILLLDSFVP